MMYKRIILILWAFPSFAFCQISADNIFLKCDSLLINNYCNKVYPGEDIYIVKDTTIFSTDNVYDCKTVHKSLSYKDIPLEKGRHVLQFGNIDTLGDRWKMSICVEKMSSATIRIDDGCYDYIIVINQAKNTFDLLGVAGLRGEYVIYSDVPIAK